MLKGYTKIELTDVHTGEKDVVEKHNLITNNLNEYVKHSGLVRSTIGTKEILCPLYNKALGGIVLLSNTIDEDANAYHIAYTSKDMLTGCAGNTVNSGTDTKVGSRNLTESKEVENGYQLVWDFGTAQANGVISAVGLTFGDVALKSEYAYAYPKDDYAFYFNSSIDGLHKYLVDYDFEKNIATLIRVVDVSTVNVTKYKFDFTTIHLKNIAGRYFSTPVLLNENISSPFELNVDGFWLDGFDGYYYYVNVISSAQQYIARMKKDTLQIDTSYGLTEINLDLSQNYNSDEINKCCAIANGYLYAPRSRNCDYNKINLSDLSEINKIKIKDYDLYFANPSAVASDGTCVYTRGSVIFPDDTAIEYNFINGNKYVGLVIGDSSPYDRKIIISKDGQAIYAQNGYDGQICKLYFLNNLNTINNLETPVTKTADKTMKITYTLTEE